MKQLAAFKQLNTWAASGRYVFTRSDLAKLFYGDSPRAFKASLKRLVSDGVLVRPSRGVYVYTAVHNPDGYAIEHIAKALRRGEYNYVSLESALSEYGAISQIPVDRLTVMTTGRKGEYHTPYGTIEFIHTKRSVGDLLPRMVDVHRPLRMATPQAAWQDLKRVGRNTHLVNTEALQGD